MKFPQKVVRPMLVLTLLNICVVTGYAQSPATVQGKEMLVSGIKVVLKSTVNKVISANLVFLGGTQNYPKELQGIENAALGATAECGTKTMTRDQFLDKLESTGSEINGFSGLDFGLISLRCVKANWDATWSLFADAVVNPSFNDKDFLTYRQKLIAQVKMRESNPDGSLNDLASHTVFKGTRYEAIPQGTAESLSQISSAAARAYYSKILNKAQIFLVVVGDIKEADLKAKVEKAFAGLPQGSFTPAAATALDVTTSDFETESRPLATNYILGVMGAPASTSANYRAYQLGMRVLYDHMFREVRTKRNLSYAPAAYMRTSLINSATLYVTTTQPNTTAKVMIDEINSVRTNGFSDKEVREKKNEFLTAYYMQQESNAAQAQSLAGAQVLFGNWKRAITVNDEINALTLRDVNGAMKTSIKAIKWVYLGKPEQANPAVFKQSMNL